MVAKKSLGYGLAAALALILVLAWPGKALASDPPDVGRLSKVAPDTFILGKDDVDWSYAEENLIVERGDLLQTNETGRAEIQFDPTLTLRIGERTRIALVEMGAEKVVGMDGGKTYLRVSQPFAEGQALILTFPAGQLIATYEALARIDVSEDGNAEVKVLRGSLGIETQSENARLVQAGEKVMITSNGWIEFEGYDIARTDDFDAWNEQRDIALSTYTRPSYLKEDLAGAEDMNGYGEWVYVEKYSSHAWRPYVVKEWRPYYYGRWYYSDYYGWTWVPQEPWGYTTYHYGSWNYHPGYGWVWVPGYEWRPAYVGWVTYDPYVGWAPLDYYGYPVITTYPYHLTSFHTGFFDVFSFTFVFFDDFHHHHVHDHFFHHDVVHVDKDIDIDIHKDIDIDIDKDINIDIDKHVGRERMAKLREHAKDRKPSEMIAERLEHAKGKPRFVENLKDGVKEDGWRKTLRKGAAAREKTNYERFLDVKNHPQMRERLAKLEKNDLRFANLNKTSVADRLPKKAKNDRVKALDFRKKFENSETRDTVALVRKKAKERNVSPRSIKDRDIPVRNLDRNTSQFRQSARAAKKLESPGTDREARSRLIETVRQKQEALGGQSRKDVAGSVRGKTQRSERPLRELYRNRADDRRDIRQRSEDRSRLRNRVDDSSYNSDIKRRLPEKDRAIRSRDSLTDRTRQRLDRSPQRREDMMRRAPQLKRDSRIRREAPSRVSQIPQLNKTRRSGINRPDVSSARRAAPQRIQRMGALSSSPRTGVNSGASRITRNSGRQPREAIQSHSGRGGSGMKSAIQSRSGRGKLRGLRR